MIKLVKQPYKYGCSIACAAMIMGKTFEEVEVDFSNDFKKEAVDEDVVFQYLADHSYSLVETKVLYYSHKNFSRELLLKIFAPSSYG